ncbi:MAG: Asp-tRNA(Asn)/Glu-tRNA(Gln) amidotransferase subunit GatA [Methermicoccaceae archaeon]
MHISDAAELARQEGCVEAVSRCLERIEKGVLNDFITIPREKALFRAEELDREWSRWEKKPLAGVPVAVKDNISTRGIRTTCASKILDGYVPPFDATVVKRLYEAGAVIVGKTNMDEFGMGSTCENSFIGACKNPHDHARVTGGSSGGSAAAVAEGEVPVALGSDTGGSIRCPAAFCGCVGLKPTYGAVSRYGLVAYANSLEQIGPLASSVRNTATLFDVIVGHDRKDSTSVQSKPIIPRIREDVSGMVVGIPKEFYPEGLDEDVENAAWNVVHSLEDVGVEHREVSIPHVAYALPAYYLIAMSEASSNLARFDGLRYGLRTQDTNWHDTFSRVRGEGFGTEVKRRIILGTYALSKGYHDRYYLKALKVRTLVMGDVERALSEVDALVAPTMPYPAPMMGDKMDDPLSMYLSDVFTVPVNLAGVPSLSIPARTKGKGGMPLGVQLIGRKFDEATPVSLALAGGWE